MTEKAKTAITLADIRARRDEILALAEKYGASNVRVFGSVARGDATPTSDVDFLVRFPARYKLLDQAGLLMDLKDLLGVEVDVSVEANLKPDYRQHILKDAVRL